MEGTIRCQQCDQVLDVANVNLDRLIARCDACNILFDCSSQVVTSAPPAAEEDRWRLRPERPPVPQPSSVEVVREGGRLRLFYRWFGFQFLFLILFCTFWDGFLIVWYATALMQKEIQWVMVLFPLGHLAVGVGLTYYTLCGLLNRTVLTVGQGQLDVRHEPLPWRGARSLPVSGLQQLFTVEHVGSKGSRTYELCAVYSDGRKVSVLSGLAGSDQALFMEQQVEAFLGIRNQAVAGEYGS